jgi:hypothetical protein
MDTQWDDDQSFRFIRHEWEEATQLFQRLAKYWDLVAASVLVPLAKEIAQDELKSAYGWIKRKLIATFSRIRDNYISKREIDRGEIQRFDELINLAESALGVLERTGINEFTTSEFARLADLEESRVKGLLIFCQFREENSVWHREILRA